VDEHGMQVGELARSRGCGRRCSQPAHQFPTGVVLAPQRRRDLLDWAAAADGLIVEDDYDAEFRYDRAPVPALHASAPGWSPTRAAHPRRWPPACGWAG
jgi:GntR family transcriptional regulator/MocR family aminotransferase